MTTKTLDDRQIMMIRECRLIFGRQAAAELWRRLGLPAVAGRQAKPAGRDGAHADQVRRFLRDSTLQRPGTRVQSSILYAAYTSWCASHDADLVLSQKMFSLNISRLGFAKHQSSMMFFEGLTLVNQITAVRSMGSDRARCAKELCSVQNGGSHKRPK